MYPITDVMLHVYNYLRFIYPEFLDMVPVPGQYFPCKAIPRHAQFKNRRCWIGVFQAFRLVYFPLFH